MAFFFEYVILGYDFFVVACTIALGIGAFWFAISATKDIQRILHAFMHKAKTNQIQANELKILLAEFIDSHVAIKQLSIQFKCTQGHRHCLNFDDCFSSSDWHKIFRTYFNP